MAIAKAAKASSYLRAALKLAATTPGGVISAGQVAYVVHRRSRPSSMFTVESAAEEAMRTSGRFERAGFDTLNLTNWKLRS